MLQGILPWPLKIDKTLHGAIKQQMCPIVNRVMFASRTFVPENFIVVPETNENSHTGRKTGNRAQNNNVSMFTASNILQQVCC